MRRPPFQIISSAEPHPASGQLKNDDADDAETAGSGFALRRSLARLFEIGTAARDALAPRAAVPKSLTQGIRTNP
jgi:hypothetical protein